MVANDRANPPADLRQIAELFRAVRKDEEDRLAVGRALLRVIREGGEAPPDVHEAEPSGSRRKRRVTHRP